jgi:hypothetical protein
VSLCFACQEWVEYEFRPMRSWRRPTCPMVSGPITLTCSARRAAGVGTNRTASRRRATEGRPRHPWTDHAGRAVSDRPTVASAPSRAGVQPARDRSSVPPNGAGRVSLTRRPRFSTRRAPYRRVEATNSPGDVTVAVGVRARCHVHSEARSFEALLVLVVAEEAEFMRLDHVLDAVDRPDEVV